MHANNVLPTFQADITILMRNYNVYDIELVLLLCNSSQILSVCLLVTLAGFSGRLAQSPNPWIYHYISSFSFRVQIEAVKGYPNANVLLLLLLLLLILILFVRSAAANIGCPARGQFYQLNWIAQLLTRNS